jgi:glycogen synthase
VRVLLVCDDYPSAFAGGVATAVMNLARGLARLGHDVVLLWPEDPLAFPIDGVRQVRTAGWRIQLGKNHIVAAAPPRAGDLPAGWIPQIIHAQQPSPLTYWARMYSKRHHIPLVVTMHNLLEHAHDALGRTVLAWMYRATLRGADVTVTPASFSTRYAIARFGLTNATTRSNSVDVSSYAQSLEVGRDGVPELLAAISFVPYKNPLMMIELIGTLKARGVTVHLSIAGKGALRETCEARVRELQLTDSVTFLGTVPHAQLLELMRAADALLLTSVVELQPMVVLESKIFGTPALVADSPLSGASDLVLDGHTGVIFPVADLERAADILEPYLRDPSRLRAMRAATRADAERFDLEPVALQMLEVYERAIAARD